MQRKVVTYRRCLSYPFLPGQLYQWRGKATVHETKLSILLVPRSELSCLYALNKHAIKMLEAILL